MNLSETSLAAFHRVDRTAGQRRVLEWFHAHPGQSFTRQEIADGTGMLLQSVCGRVPELIKLDDLKPLKQSRNGGELLSLNAQQSTHCDGNMAGEFRSPAVTPCGGSKVIASPAARNESPNNGPAENSLRGLTPFPAHSNSAESAPLAAQVPKSASCGSDAQADRVDDSLRDATAYQPASANPALEICRRNALDAAAKKAAMREKFPLCAETVEWLREVGMASTARVVSMKEGGNEWRRR